jgi:uridine kinase
MKSSEEGVSGEAESSQTQGAAAAARDLPFVLGIVGDSGSGKRTVADGVRHLLGPENVADLLLDDYHRLSRAERIERGLTALNPSVHNLTLMHEHLQLLRSGRQIRNRSYDHADGTFGPIRAIEPREVVIARGLLGFPSEELRSAYDLAVFLHPDPELLIRWKLRRDVQSRGYTEAEVLKYIAQHLLDAKQFVIPQAERADMVVRYEIPDYDAPDSEVLTSLTLRRAAADLMRGNPVLERFGPELRVEEEGEELVLRLAPDLKAEEVNGWGEYRFPDTYDPAVLGNDSGAGGGPVHRSHLCFVQILIARLTYRLRRQETG